MAKGRSKEGRDVQLDYVFDRQFAAKLQQAYDLLAPEHARQVGGRALGEDDEDRRDLRTGVLGPAEGGQDDCQPDGRVDRLCKHPRLQRAGRHDLRRRRV